MTWRRVILGIVLVSMMALRLCYLNADFPPGLNWSGDLYTDEGWYSSGAVRYYLTGNWIFPGDFNPVVNLPVYQLSQYLVFKIFGLSLTSARIGAVLWLWGLVIILYFLLKKFVDFQAAFLSVLLFASDPLIFAYSRLAFLEIPAITLCILGLYFLVLVQDRRKWVLMGFVPLFFSLAILTKTTAVFVIPVACFLVLRMQSTARIKLLFCLLIIGGVFVLCGGITWWLWNTHNSDYQYFLNLNFNARVNFSFLGYVKNFASALKDFLFFNVAYLTAFLLVILLMVISKYSRKEIVIQLCIVWFLSYIGIMSTTNYQPVRYFVPLIPVVNILLGLCCVYFAKTEIRWLQVAAVLLFITITILNCMKITNFLVSANFSYVSMMEDIKEKISQTDQENNILLGHFSNSISLGTGVVSINDHLGTQSLDWKIKYYKPNYYVSLGENVEILQELSHFYKLELLSQYNVFENYYSGQPVYFYKLSDNLTSDIEH